MNSQDLADRVVQICTEAIGPFKESEQAVVDAAVSRIMGVGDQQYSEGDKQKFELVSPDKLLEMFEEETVDQVNYGVMFLTRVRESPDENLMELGTEAREWVSNECLYLIEQAVKNTIYIKIIRQTLANAKGN